MSIKFTDSISVKFHQLFGGNISSKTASRLATQFRSATNIPADIRLALENKDRKHPELQLNLTLALVHAGNAEKILLSGEEIERQRITANNNLIDNFGSEVNALAKKIFSSITQPLDRACVGYDLQTIYKIDFTCNDKFKGNIAAWKGHLADKKKELENIGVSSNDSDAKEDLGNKTKVLQQEIKTISETIAELQSYVDYNNNKIAEAIIIVADGMGDRASKRTQAYLDQLNALVSAFKSAPNIIAKSEAGLEKLISMREDVKAWKDNVNHLVDMSAIKKIIEESRQLLEAVTSSNEQLAQQVSQIMTEEGKKAAEITNVLSASASAKPPVNAQRDKQPTQPLKFPDIPDNKPEAKQQRAQKALLSASAG